MLLKEYIRLACGDTDIDAQALSDAEINDILNSAIIKPSDSRFVELAEKSQAGITVLNQAGWMSLDMFVLDQAGVKFGCGIGGFLEGMSDVYLDGAYHLLLQGESLNNLTGVLTLATPPAEGTEVVVRTYLIDMPQAVHDENESIVMNVALLPSRVWREGL